MAHKFETELQEFTAWYQSGLNLADTIDAPELTALRLRLRSVCNREIGFIQSLLGAPRPGRPIETAVRQPLTHFYGVPIQFTGAQPAAADPAPPNGSQI